MDQLNMQAAFEVGRVVHLFFAPAFFSGPPWFPKTLARRCERCENPTGVISAEGCLLHDPHVLCFDLLCLWFFFHLGCRLKVRFYSGVNLNSYANQKVHVIVKAEQL